jgi:WD40 repeat protein
MEYKKSFRKVSWIILSISAIAIAIAIALSDTGCSGLQLSSSSLSKVQLLRTLTGHSSGVASVAISPDGQTLASGSRDETIKLWDLATGKLLHTLTGHSSDVASVAISPDGQTLASGSDKTIKLWDLATGKLLHTQMGHSDGVGSVAFSPNGQTLASSGYDETVKLWDINQRKLTPMSTLLRSGLGSAIAFSPDGRTLAVSNPNDRINPGFAYRIDLHDLVTDKVLLTLSEHSYPIDALAFSPDGQTLASSSGDKTIKLWEFKTGKLLHTLSGEADWFNYDFDPNDTPIDALAFSPDRQILATGSTGTRIRLWDFHTGKLLCDLKGHSEVVNTLAFSPDGEVLASGSHQDHTIKIWNISK